eukprot:SAG31_NODE_987_length_10544_cov_56.002106_1_plen_2161_part_00
MAAISAQFWSKSKANKAQAEPGRTSSVATIAKLSSTLKLAEKRAKENKPKLGPRPSPKLRRSKTLPAPAIYDWTPPSKQQIRQQEQQHSGNASAVLQASISLRSIAAAKKRAYREKQATAAAEAHIGTAPNAISGIGSLLGSEDADRANHRDEYSRRTLWIGAIPEHAANEIFLHKFFSSYGDVVTVAVRYKPNNTKSWAVVTFADDVSASICLDEDVVIAGEKLIVRRTILDSSPIPELGSPDKIWDTAVRYQPILGLTQPAGHADAGAAMTTGENHTPATDGNDGRVDDVSDGAGGEFWGCFAGRWIRHHLQWLLLSRACEWTLKGVVLLNCVTLIAWDPQDNASDFQRAVRTAEDVFTWTFATEAVLKIAAFGVWKSDHAYFRSAWNCLDFFICVTSLLDFFIRNHSDFALMRATRSFRPLRVLTRSISLQVLVYSVLSSIPRLQVVFNVLVLVFVVCGLFSVHLWMGLFYNRCFAPDDTSPSEENSTSPFFYSSRPTLCSVGQFGRHCPAGTECRAYDWNPFFDIISYNSLIGGFIIVFQTMTLSNWSELMYMTMDVSGFAAALYFIVLVLAASFLVTNLLIAILKTEYEANVMAMEEQSRAVEKKRAQARWKKSVSKVKLVSLMGKNGSAGKALQPLRPVTASAASSAVGRGMNEDEQQTFLQAFVTPQPVLTAREVTAADTADKVEAGKVVAVLSAKSKLRAAVALLSSPLLVRHDNLDMHTEQISEQQPLMKRIRRMCYRLQASKFFVAMLTAIVIVNAGLLASVHHGMSVEFENALELGMQICTIFFVVEFVVKIVGLGAKLYFEDRFNCLDAFIVFTSTLELMVGASVLDSLKITNTAKLLRVLRLLKLIQYIIPLKDMVAAVVKSLGTLFWIVILMVVTICVFALMGMQLFGGKFNFPDGTPRHNFDTFAQAFVTVWQVITLSDWEEVLFDSVRAWEGSKWCYFYYLSLLIVAVYVLFNIFIIIILGSFSQQYSDSRKDGLAQALKEDLIGESARVFSEAYREYERAHGISLNLHRSAKPSSMHEHHDDHQSTEKHAADSEIQSNQDSNTEAAKDGQILRWDVDLLPNHKTTKAPPDSGSCCAKIRKKCYWLMQTNSFNNFVFIVIILNCIGMALEHPHVAGECAVNLFNTECAGDGSMCTPKFCASRGFGHIDAAEIDGLEYSTCIASFCLEHTATQLDCLRIPPLSTERQTCLANARGEQRHSVGPYTHVTSYTWIDIHTTSESVLYWLDVVFNFVYIAELMIKFAALSLSGYFKSRWNRLDFLIVITSAIGMLFTDSEVKIFKYFRLLRILRPIRLVAKAKTMRMMLESMMLSAVAIINVELLLLFFLMIFAVIGNNLFAGLFYDCSRDDGAGIEWEPECVGTFVKVEVNCDQDRRSQTCIEGTSISERQWQNYPQNFDNIWTSFMTFFQLATLQGWVEVARLTIDTTEVGHVPVEQNKPHMIFFTLTYVLFCSYFFMNIFVGVIYANFQDLKNVYIGKREMNFYQLRWLDVLEIITRSTPTRRVLPPAGSKNSLRRKVFRLVTAVKFENMVGLVIIINSLMMAFEYYTMPKSLTQVFESCDTIFTVIFALEATCKIYGLGWHQYWSDAWNKFDLIICIFAGLDVMLKVILGSFRGTEVLKVFRLGRIFARILKIVRIGRTVRLAKSVHGLKLLFAALSTSIPYVATCFGLFVVLLYIYAVFGTAAFGSIRRGEFLHDRANFEHFGNSMLTMFRVSTGDAWETLYTDMSIQPPLCSTSQDGTPGDDCGSPVMATIYLTSFQVFMGLIMMNVLVSVFLENFDEIEVQERFIVNQEKVNVFASVWSELAPGMGLMMPVKLLPTFLRRLPPPLGLGCDATNLQIFKMLQHLHLPSPGCKHGISGDRCLIEAEVATVSYSELLYALCWRRCGVQVPCNRRTKEVQKKLHDALHEVEAARLALGLCDRLAKQDLSSLNTKSERQLAALRKKAATLMGSSRMGVPRSRSLRGNIIAVTVIERHAVHVIERHLRSWRKNGAARSSLGSVSQQISTGGWPGLQSTVEPPQPRTLPVNPLKLRVMPQQPHGPLPPGLIDRLEQTDVYGSGLAEDAMATIVEEDEELSPGSHGSSSPPIRDNDDMHAASKIDDQMQSLHEDEGGVTYGAGVGSLDNKRHGNDPSKKYFVKSIVGPGP